MERKSCMPLWANEMNLVLVCAGEEAVYPGLEIVEQGRLAVDLFGLPVEHSGIVESDFSQCYRRAVGMGTEAKVIAVIVNALNNIAVERLFVLGQIGRAHV